MSPWTTFKVAGSPKGSWKPILFWITIILSFLPFFCWVLFLNRSWAFLFLSWNENLQSGTDLLWKGDCLRYDAQMSKLVFYLFCWDLWMVIVASGSHCWWGNACKLWNILCSKWLMMCEVMYWLWHYFFDTDQLKSWKGKLLVEICLFCFWLTKFLIITVLGF